MAKKQMCDPSSRYFYPWPIVLVSCVDEGGKPNIITIGASSICSSNPPTVGIAVGTMQYSLELINRTKDFGVNLPTADQVWEADFCGSQTGRKINKFEATGFTVQEPAVIQSPLIAECPMSMECKLIETVHLGNHDWLIGEIVAVHCDESVLDERGRFDPSKCNPIFAFWNEYWSVGEKLAEWHYSRGATRQ
ncbi:MAG: flavin reductase family protein [Armatimonadetes bacterium]|nr:flavin reductase family protein [Armatimonadota bacterium]